MDIHRIKPLFDELSALPKAEQAKRLAELPIGDNTRRALGRLLQIDDDLAAIPDAIVPPASAAPALPDRIGPYRVERMIGSGGMGQVYAASRTLDGVDQRVAIKVIRQNRADDAGIARFRTERQVLALLKHPNIATLFDWGDDALGQPYLVMELAEGLPIDQHVVRNNLSIAERVRLVRVVATAIAHAHQNLIVHRDLKPGNVLVDAHGMVKVIDFGIAKPLMPSLGDTAIESTGTDQRFFSPRSAAPELLRGGLATPACDIYGLGVLLYELLTERPVFDLKGRSAAEIERMILEQDPLPPSRVAPARPGLPPDADLDAIVLCCLRKDPGDRYTSVERLIDDLDAWAGQRPVAARRGGPSYRARRFLARHRRLLAGSVVATVLLAVSAFLILRANQTTDVAVARSDQYAALLLSEVDRSVGIGEGTQDDEIRSVLDLVFDMLAQREDTTGLDPAGLQLDHAEALLRIGDLDAARDVANTVAAKDSGFDASDRRKAALLARIHFGKGDAKRAQDDIMSVHSTSMDPDFLDMRFLYWRSVLHAPDLKQLREFVVGAGQNRLSESTRRAHLLLLGDVDAAMGNDDLARASYEAILERTDSTAPGDILSRLEVHRRMVALALREQDAALADEHHAAARDLTRRMSGDQAEPGLAMRVAFHGLSHVSPHVSAAYIEAARNLMRYRGMGTEVLAECERLLRNALAFDPDHGNTHVLLGYVLTHSGRGEEARKTLDRALELGADSPWLHVNRAELLRLSGDLAGAREALELAIGNPALPDDARGAALMMLGTVQAELGLGTDARQTFEAAIRHRPDAAVIGNYARTLRVNLLDIPAAEARAREAFAMTGGARWHAENLGATLWLKWAEMRQSGANKADASAVRAEAAQLVPNPASLVSEFHRYPRMHPIMAAVRDLGVPLHENPDAGPGATTIMELAVNSGNVAIIRGLVELGVDPDIRGFEAFPPLGLAIQRGRGEVVDALLDLGANPHLRATDGESILDLARRTPGLDPRILARLATTAEGLDARGELKDGTLPAIGWVYRFVKAPGPGGGGDNSMFQQGQQWRFIGPRRPYGFATATTDGTTAAVTELEFARPDGTIRARWRLPEAQLSSWRDVIEPDDGSPVVSR